MAVPKSRGDASTTERKKAWGERAKAAMDKRNLEGVAVAKAVGVKPQSVSDWRSGRSFPAVENLIAFSDLVGESISFLIGDRLHGKNSIEALSRGLGTRLGHARLSALEKVPDAELKDAIDLLLGRQVAKGSSRK